MTALNEYAKLKDNVTFMKVLKFVGGATISCGAMAVVVAAFRLPIRSSKGITKMLMSLGAFILGCKAGDIAEDYFNQEIDKLGEEVAKTINMAKEELNRESASK